MLSYRDVPRTLTQNATLDQRRRQLFGNFVEAMFRRRGGKSRYSEEQTTRWLSSLASTLTRNNQTVFYLENIEFEWLPTRAKQLLARVGLIIAGGLIAGLIVWPIGFWLNQELTSGLLFGLIVGLIVGLLSAFLKLHPVERTGFRWTDVSSRKSAALRDGLTGGLIVGLLLGLLGGLSGGLIVGLIRLFTSEAIPETHSSVNEGTHRSIRMASMSLLILRADRRAARRAVLRAALRAERRADFWWDVCVEAFCFTPVPLEKWIGSSSLCRVPRSGEGSALFAPSGRRLHLYSPPVAGVFCLAFEFKRRFGGDNRHSLGRLTHVPTPLLLKPLDAGRP